jgi:SAM-dependent MidA family methyltransferase
MTVAAFMEAVLYHPTLGYYAAAAQRSGRGGDFYTSVDAGPLFGQCLAEAAARAWRALGGSGAGAFDLVEAGAGNGRLMRDLLDALRLAAPGCYDAVRVTLVERSGTARATHVATLGAHAGRLAASSPDLPERITGLLVANELLDAMPVHRVIAARDGLREAFVDADGDRLVVVTGPLSSPALASYFEEAGVRLPPGTVADISPAAVSWVRRAARALRRGYLLLVDYGHEAARLFGAGPASGTLRAYRRHVVDPGSSSLAQPAWLADPGSCDLTAHVDFTALGKAMLDEGLTVVPRMDQTALLLRLGLANLLSAPAADERSHVRRNLAARTLVVPGGLGSTHSALVAARGTRAPGEELGL